MRVVRPIDLKSLGTAIAAGALLLTTVSTTAYATRGVAVSPSSVKFGSQTVGSVSAPVGVTVSNSSRQSIQIRSVLLASLQFIYSGPSLPLTLRPGQNFSGTVTFDPSGAKRTAMR